MVQMVRSEGQAIRCLVIHSLPTRRGKPRLVCMYLPVSASVQLEQSSSLAPAKLPYLAAVWPQVPRCWVPHASVSRLPRAPESVIGRLGSCPDFPESC